MHTAQRAAGRRRVALQESMKRFDASSSLASLWQATPTEQRPPRHDETDVPSKDLLHWHFSTARARSSVG